MATRMQRTTVPGIFKRGNQYVVVWRHRGKQHKEAFRTLAEAREAKGGRMHGDRKPPNRQTFEEYAEDWLRTYQGRTSRGLAESTREGYHRSITKWAIPFLGRLRMSEIGPRDVRAFVAWMEDKGVNQPSIRKNMAPVKALFATAYEDEDIKANPTRVRVRSRTASQHDDEGKAKAMTREELGLVLTALPEQWQPFFTFLAHTGLRISEALGLVWGDVDLGVAPCVRVHSQLGRKGTRSRLKTRNSRRTLPLSPAMAQTLRERRAASYAGEDAPLWPNTRGGPLHANNLRNRVLAPVVAPLGLESVGFHSFRHTCASLLFESGKSIVQVSRWLGHADPGFTLRTYVHLMDEGLGDAACLDAALGLSEVAAASR
jgi:integrase